MTTRQLTVLCTWEIFVHVKPVPAVQHLKEAKEGPCLFPTVCCVPGENPLSLQKILSDAKTSPRDIPFPFFTTFIGLLVLMGLILAPGCQPDVSTADTEVCCKQTTGGTRGSHGDGCDHTFSWMIVLFSYKSFSWKGTKRKRTAP